MKRFLVLGTCVVSAVVMMAAGVWLVCPKHVNGHTHGCVAASTLGAQERVQELNVTAKAAFLVEANSGKVLFAKDENKRLPIASMVKITTLGVIFDALKDGAISMGDKVMVSPTASGMGGSQAFLDFDSEYVVEDLVKSIIIASANDSCVAMAERIAGSESEFVGRMNALAGRLGMSNTNYVNCTGLPAANSYSCAADVAKMYQYIMKSPFYNYNGMNKVWMYDLSHPSGRVTGLTNTNRHARFFEGCVGGKTGFTAEAGHCITVAAVRGAMKPLAVIIGAKDSQARFNESGALLNHVFNGYENKLIVDANQKIATMRLKNAFADEVGVYARENYYDLVKKGAGEVAPTVTVELGECVNAPVKRDTAVGKVIVTDEGVVVREIDVVTGVDVDDLNFYEAVKKATGVYKFFR